MKTEIGITPAHAGKSIPQQGEPAAHEDHPRACGEKTSRIGFAAITAGSPPRMRGKVRRWVTDRGQHRITPAHAGKSQAYRRAWSPW